MGRTEEIKNLSETELEVMQIIWDHQPPVSRSIVEQELCKDRSLAPSTIITFLSRLCDKGYLTLEKKGRTNLYTPAMSRKEYLAGENRSFINRLYKGSISDFAAALCDSGISREDMAELCKLLEENS